MDFLLTLILWVIFTISGIHKTCALYLYKSKLWMVTLCVTLAGGFLLLSIFPDFALFS